MFKLRGYLIAGTANLHAKCTVHNMIQFNGKYSKSRKRCGSYISISIWWCNRTKAYTSIITWTSRKIIPVRVIWMWNKRTLLAYSIAVLSPFQEQLHWLHALCIAWSDKTSFDTLVFKREFEWTLYTVNRRLAKLQPPLFITRAPRPLSELKYWKASEYKSFLLYYGPVILVDILNSSYHSHFFAFKWRHIHIAEKVNQNGWAEACWKPIRTVCYDICYLVLFNFEFSYAITFSRECETTWSYLGLFMFSVWRWNNIEI